MLVKNLIEKLKILDENLEITKELLEEMIPKKKNRSPGIKYKKSELKRKEIAKKLKELIYINYRLTNENLIKKLKISKSEFYKTKLNILTKNLKKEYKNQSLF